MAPPPLKIVLVLSDLGAVPDWLARLVRHIGNAPTLQICAVAIAVPGPVPRACRGGGLFQLVRRLELLAGAGRGSLAPDALAGFWQYLPCVFANDEQALTALGADVILDLSGNHGHGLPPAAARHGIWFTDAIGAVPGLAGLRPLLDGQPTSTITLFRRTRELAMPKSIASAELNIKFIATRNEAFMAEKTVTLIMRELTRTSLGLPPLQPPGDVLFVAPRAPRLGQTLGYLRRMTAELVRRAWQAACARLGLRPGMFCINLATGDPLTFDPARARTVRPPGDCYHADPFLWQRGGEDWCFFEVFDYPTGTGRISAGRLEGDRLVDIRTVLAPGYHLSFPFLFEHRGELFMLPEACAMRRIEIWRCTAFPDRWELHTTALEGTNAADSMLAQIKGQWWLFTNLSEDPYGDVSSELHLYRADSPLLGTLEAHPLNPVVFNSRCARNAGRIHHRDDGLLRPAQDNSHGTYGFGLNLMRIEELTMTGYRESCARRIAPAFKRGIIGCHHLDIAGDRIVFDVRHPYGGRG